MLSMLEKGGLVPGGRGGKPLQAEAEEGMHLSQSRGEGTPRKWEERSLPHANGCLYGIKEADAVGHAPRSLE